MHSPEKPLVAAVGEVLWDLLPDGEQLGGTTANFAWHAREAGARVALVSAVGEDPRGRRIVERMAAQGVETGAVAVLADKATGTVDVVLDAHGLPTYAIVEDVAWDHIPWSGAVAEVAARADAVCWGSLAQRAPTSRATIERFLDSAGPGVLRICDINLRAEVLDRGLIEGTLARADVLKCNDEELPRIADLLGVPAGDELDRLRGLMQRYEIAVAALTRGARGSALLRGGEIDLHPGFRVPVVDTVGAGDALAAELATGLLLRRPLREVHERANRRAAAVCARSGGTPELGPDPRIDDAADRVAGS